MTIPEIRGAMNELARALDAGEVATVDAVRLLRRLAEETRRRQPVHRAPRRPPVRVTKAQILAYFAAHPGSNYMDVSLALNVKNTGRISEILAGFRR
jgi:hypothetical protein